MDAVKVPVEALRKGLYVAELDRPWVETPFLFQGFELDSDEQLETLRRYCRHVYVDRDRSRVALPATAPAQPPKRDPVSRRQRDFRAAAEQGLERRRTGLAGLRALFEDVRLGRAAEIARAEEVVTGVVDTVVSDAEAALWLTQLRDRDEYTSIHSLNVCVLALAFCFELGFERQALQTIGLGALLHDIGKTFTPLEILNKPGALTDEEFATIKRHPEDGYQLLRQRADLPQQALDIVRYHHERVSGSGYPFGLTADRLSTPVLAVAVADVYDALSSERPYRAGMGSTAALALMRKDAELTFGRELLNAFIRCVGIYPVGSLVELHSGAQGVVVATREDYRLLPEILLIRDADGRELETPRRIDLAAQSEQANDPGQWAIRRGLTPDGAGIDPVALVDRALGGPAGDTGPEGDTSPSR